MPDVAQFFGNLVIFMVVLLFAVSAHECAHAWMSRKFGDDTAYLLGRVTLNPVKHTDPIGTLLIPIIGFLLGSMGGTAASIPLVGWGIPTPVNPRNWRNYKLANVMVSIAGILANLSIAIAGFIIFKALIEGGVFRNQAFAAGIGRPIALLLQELVFLNISLAVFNLLPFPPLDGSKVLETFLPYSAQPFIRLMEQYGFLILLLLMYWGVIRAIMYPVYYFINYLLITPWF